MIKDMIRPMIRSMTRPMIAAITRYFSQLNGVNSHYAYNPITFTGDFEWEILFTCDDNSTARAILADSGTSDDLLIRSGDGRVRMAASGGTVTFNTNVVDGLLHTVVIARSGSTVTCTLDGVADGSGTVSGSVTLDRIGTEGASNPFSGIIATVKLTDLSGAPVTTTFVLDSAPGVTVKSSSEGNNTVTGVNIAVDDTELFQSGDNQWDNISPEPQELPAVIEIA